MTNISQKLDELPVAQSECTIYRVHGNLRNINDKAYDPEVIAIGPYHRGKDNLKMMEGHKLRYLKLLLNRKSEAVDKYISAIEPPEQDARKCYANPIGLNPTEFKEMLILDGCFIIELVKKYNMIYLREKNDPIFRMDWIIYSLQRDLMLFENQIPFVVLCKLFDLIEVPNQHRRLMYLLTGFFRTAYPGVVRIDGSNGSSHEIKHLLGLIHIDLVSSFKRLILVQDKRKIRLIESATSLQESGVKFKKLEGASLFDVKFQHETLRLTPLTIGDQTESFLRNLIAYEQYFHDTGTRYVTDYVKFFGCLIRSQRDVKVLSRVGIIKNWFDDDVVVVDIFNKLTDSVVMDMSKGLIYDEIFDEVNKHPTKKRMKKHKNRWMAKLWSDYLTSPWAVISIVAATVLLLLTVAQTVFSVLQVV